MYASASNRQIVIQWLTQRQEALFELEGEAKRKKIAQDANAYFKANRPDIIDQMAESWFYVLLSEIDSTSRQNMMRQIDLGNTGLSTAPTKPGERPVDPPAAPITITPPPEDDQSPIVTRMRKRILDIQQSDTRLEEFRRRCAARWESMRGIGVDAEGNPVDKLMMDFMKDDCAYFDKTYKTPALTMMAQGVFIGKIGTTLKDGERIRDRYDPVTLELAAEGISDQVIQRATALLGTDHFKLLVE